MSMTPNASRLRPERGCVLTANGASLTPTNDMRPNFALRFFAFFAVFHALTAFGNSNADTSGSEDELITANLENDTPVVEAVGEDLHVTVEDEVLVLNADNFDRVVYTKPVILVEFYAPWCGHCKALEPEYAKAAKILKENEPKVVLAKVDATVEETLSKRFEISGYPTLFYFKNGEKYEYDGPRTASGIVDYMREKADPNYVPPKDAVLVLTKENFTEIVNKEDIILVEFYAPWCGHCKKLAPEYKRAAKELSEISNPIKLAKVDATIENELKEEYNIEGFPTLLIFRKGKRYNYDGPRDEQGIVRYMKEQQISPSKILDSVKQLDKLINAKGSSGRQSLAPTVLGFFDNENSPYYELFIDAANEQRDKAFRFLHTFDKSLAKSLKEKVNTITLMQPEIFSSDYEPSRYRLTLDEDTTKEDILYFIGNNSIPLVGERNYHTTWLYDGKYPLVVVYFDVDFGYENIVATQLIRKKVLKVANKFRGKVTFAISKEEDYEHELRDLGLDDSGEDVNVGFFKSQNIRYAMPPDEFDEEKLETFVQDVLDGKIKQKIKSQPEPANNNGAVTIVVGSTFKKLVTDNPRNVLIEFYAPWCGHCQKLEPIYLQLAQHYASKRDKISIAKIDATSNDYPEIYNVSGFPTIYYVSHKNKSKPILYNGDRSLSDLIKFVDQMIENESGAKEEL
ncbi:Protein disulfide-isomerase A4-like protein [Dinothrombium tinctorium]|uniref:Protein disulfide-isomerase n=1 Tax=Dinothrombium tinctorium TaxID=1965070 RepID=A0A3S3Q9L4_9ACAR|nr:Protein disulfide-isomerase A4-like protein [Dinothrombium tinctorium]